MTSTLKAFKRRALSDPRVKHEYGKLHAEFAYLDEVLKARAAARLTQAEVAERIAPQIETPPVLALQSQPALRNMASCVATSSPLRS